MDRADDEIAVVVDDETRVVLVCVLGDVTRWGQREFTLLARELRRLREEWEPKGFTIRLTDET